MTAGIANSPDWTMSVDRYVEMVRSGAISDDAPLELIDGMLVPKMPKNRGHSRASKKLRRAADCVVSSGWYVDEQQPVRLPDGMPEPDLMIVRGHEDDYAEQPTAADVGLVAEVADSSLGRDTGVKCRAYARAGVPAYWIINLIDRRIEVYTNPAGTGDDTAYADRRDYAPGDEVPVVLDGVAVGRVRVDDVLP